MRCNIKVLLLVLLYSQLFAHSSSALDFDESAPHYEVEHFLGGWGNTGDIYVNSKREASISPNKFAKADGTIITIPFPTGVVSPTNYFLYVEGINENGNVILNLANQNSNQPDIVGIYNSSLNNSFQVQLNHGSIPANFIKHFAFGISDKDELIGRSSDGTSSSDIFWLRDILGTIHIINSPSGCILDYVTAVNVQGVVLGQCTSSTGLSRGFVWTITAGPQLLPGMGLPGENFLSRAIDRSGTVYGELTYSDPLTAPILRTIAVRVGANLPMVELPNSRVPSVLYTWDEGFKIRGVSSDGSRILGERYTAIGGEEVVYFNNSLAPSLYDVSQLVREIQMPSGVNVKFYPGSISNSVIGGVFADWNLGQFRGAVLKPVGRLK